MKTSSHFVILFRLLLFFCPLPCLTRPGASRLPGHSNSFLRTLTALDVFQCRKSNMLSISSYFHTNCSLCLLGCPWALPRCHPSTGTADSWAHGHERTHTNTPLRLTRAHFSSLLRCSVLGQPSQTCQVWGKLLPTCSHSAQC